MQTLLSIILLLLFVPFAADASTVAINKTDIKKPVIRKNMDPNPLSTQKKKQADQKFWDDIIKQMTEERPYVSYKHQATGIKVKHPDNWKEHEFPKNRGFSIAEDWEKIRSFIQVTVDPIANKKDKSLQEIDIWFMNKATLSPENLLIDWYMPSFNLISSEDSNLFGKPARKYVYTAEVESNKLQFMLYIASIGQKLYAVRYAAQPNAFDSDMRTFEHVFSTLKLTPVEATVKKLQGRTRR
jgi:hypothetical protein